MANRGVWEVIDSASPAVSLAAEEADINFYLSVYETCLDELTTQRNRTDHRASHGTERTIFEAGVGIGFWPTEDKRAASNLSRPVA